VKKLIAYLHHYRQPAREDLQARASESYRQYVADHPRWLGDIGFCAAYKHAYIRAYRQSYARAKVDELGKFYN
jgi:uncharacterized membrane protein